MIWNVTKMCKYILVHCPWVSCVVPLYYVLVLKYSTQIDVIIAWKDFQQLPDEYMMNIWMWSVL